MQSVVVVWKGKVEIVSKGSVAIAKEDAVTVLWRSNLGNFFGACLHLRAKAAGERAVAHSAPKQLARHLGATWHTTKRERWHKGERGRRRRLPAHSLRRAWRGQAAVRRGRDAERTCSRAKVAVRDLICCIGFSILSFSRSVPMRSFSTRLLIIASTSAGRHGGGGRVGQRGRGAER